MNHAFISGNVAREPDVRYNNDMAIAKFSVGVNRGKDKGTDWINCVAFGKTAEIIEKNVSKGDRITVDGCIRTGSYEKDGQKVYTTEVLANIVEFAPKEKELSTDDLMKIVNKPLKNDGFMDVPSGMEQEGLPFN